MSFVVPPLQIFILQEKPLVLKYIMEIVDNSEADCLFDLVVHQPAYVEGEYDEYCMVSDAENDFMDDYAWGKQLAKLRQVYKRLLEFPEETMDYPKWEESPLTNSDKLLEL